jgi:TRAP-type C4-dicarboxylate transport system permease small subunit
MQSVTKWIDFFLSRFLIVLMALMVLDVTWQVFTRFVLQDSSSYTEELAQFFLIWIGVLGASYAVRTKAHLGIDIIMQKLTGRQREYTVSTVYGLVFLFAFVIMVIGGMRLVMLTFSLDQLSAAMGIRMGYIYAVLPLSGLLMMYYSVFFVHAILINRKNG